MSWADADMRSGSTFLDGCQDIRHDFRLATRLVSLGCGDGRLPRRHLQRRPRDGTGTALNLTCARVAWGKLLIAARRFDSSPPILNTQHLLLDEN